MVLDGNDYQKDSAMIRSLKLSDLPPSRKGTGLMMELIINHTKVRKPS
jgi:hypothetical protein